MKNILRLLAITITLVGCVAMVEAQQPKKVWRIGYLSPVDAASDSARAEGVRLALRERGHIEGQNIAIEYRYAEGKLDRVPELAAELVRLKVDIIVAGGTAPAQAAKNATKTIPIVMTGGGGDPVELGLIESLARPGGNVTGITLLATELGGKRLELLKEAVPKLARIAMLYDPANPVSVLDVKEVLPVAARALKLTLPFSVGLLAALLVRLRRYQPDRRVIRPLLALVIVVLDRLFLGRLRLRRFRHLASSQSVAF